MSAPDEPMLLFAEEGSSWRPVAVGPLLALGGALLESTAPGGTAWGLWLVVAVVIGGITALIVSARRRFLRVELTATHLREGSAVLPVADIAVVRPDDGSGSYGMRVLGDGPVVPRKYDDVALVLRDGSYCVAWARDGDGLRRALALVVDSPTADDPADPAEGTVDPDPAEGTVDPDPAEGTVDPDSAEGRGDPDSAEGAADPDRRDPR